MGKVVPLPNKHATCAFNTVMWGLHQIPELSSWFCDQAKGKTNHDIVGKGAIVFRHMSGRKPTPSVSSINSAIEVLASLPGRGARGGPAFPLGKYVDPIDYLEFFTRAMLDGYHLNSTVTDKGVLKLEMLGDVHAMLSAIIKSTYAVYGRNVPVAHIQVNE